MIGNQQMEARTVTGASDETRAAAAKDPVKQDRQQQNPAYNREEKLKELLAQDEKKSPWADEFFGF